MQGITEMPKYCMRHVMLRFVQHAQMQHVLND